MFTQQAKTIQRIGIFDSGIGGLTIAHAIAHLPVKELIYVADTAHLPYGEKTPSQIQAYTVPIVQFLLDKQADIVVIACHTACCAAYTTLTREFPQATFIDMIEGTVANALAQTRSNRIGVIGTQSTIDSHVYTQKLHEYNPEVHVVERACPQLVPLIEHDLHDHESIMHALKIYLSPLILRDIDTLILGCTHYILIQKLIQEIVGSQVTIVQAQQPVKKQMEQLVRDTNQSSAAAPINIYVTGQETQFINPYATIIDRPIQQITF